MYRHLLGVTFLLIGQHSLASTLCAKNELVYFSCLAGEKIVSLCTSNPISSESGYLQYRFGVPGKVEMEYPTQKAHPKKLFTHYSAGFARGYIAHINFTSGKYTYAIYFTLTGSFKNGRPEGHNKSSGVKVVRDGKVIKDIPCRNSASAELRDDNEQLFAEGGPYEYWLFTPEL